MAKPDDVMGDVRTTAHREDRLGQILNEVKVMLAGSGHSLVAIVANSPEGVAILRAPGIPFELSEVLMRALDEAGMMKEDPDRR